PDLEDHRNDRAGGAGGGGAGVSARARSALLLAGCLCFTAPVAFAAGIPIRCRVLDSGGAPLAKVPVRLVPLASVYAAPGQGEVKAAARTETAADGDFLLLAPD